MDDNFNIFLIVFAASAVISVILFFGMQRSMRSQRIRERLFVERGGSGKKPATPGDREPRGLSRWLFLAGYRLPGSALLFILATLAMAGIGLLIAFVIRSTHVLDRSAMALEDAPTQIYEMAHALIDLAPLAIIVVLAMIPMLVVRASRRRIVREVEMDLPVTLELLATLAESGQSFDAGLDRVLRSSREDRALQREFRTFQAEVLAGRARVESLRRVSRRLDVTSFSSFISAIVQAESTGSGIAAVLRRQANDLRSRRRERALEFAMSLPVKRLLPMIICFLPAILVAALGPSVFALVREINSYLSSGSLGQ